MKFNLAIPDAHLQAQRHFAIQNVQRIAPWIADAVRLNAHVRAVLFGRVN